MSFENGESGSAAVESSSVESTVVETPSGGGDDSYNTSKPYDPNPPKEAAAPAEPKKEAGPKEAPTKIKTLSDLRAAAENGGLKKAGTPNGGKPGLVKETAKEGEAGAGDVAGVGSFTPKLSVMIRNKPVAIPEKYAALMTDDKSQREVHELFEKAHGLDVIKPRHQELIANHEKATTELKHVLGSVNGARGDYQAASKALASGDMTSAMNHADSFFKKLNVPEDFLFRYAFEKAKFYELPADQQKLINDRKAAQSQAETLQTTAQSTEQRLVASEAKLMSLDLDSQLAKPEVKSVSDFFEGLEGQEAGAFRDMVVNYGIEQYNLGKQLSPEQAIQGVIKRFGLSSLAKAGAPNPAGAQSGTPAVDDEPGEPGAETPPPQTVKKRVVASGTLPNVASKGGSPTKAPIKNLKQLKEFANAFGT